MSEVDRTHGKYTVIYGESWGQFGSHSYLITKYKHITVQDGEKIFDITRKEGIGDSQIWFIFNGHSQLEDSE